VKTTPNNINSSYILKPTEDLGRDNFTSHSLVLDYPSKSRKQGSIQQSSTLEISGESRSNSIKNSQELEQIDFKTAVNGVRNTFSKRDMSSSHYTNVISAKKKPLLRHKRIKSEMSSHEAGALISITKMDPELNRSNERIKYNVDLDYVSIPIKEQKPHMEHGGKVPSYRPPDVVSREGNKSQLSVEIPKPYSRKSRRSTTTIYRADPEKEK